MKIIIVYHISVLHEMSISQGFRAMDSTEKTVTNSNRMLEFLSATAFTAAWVGNYINTSSKSSRFTELWTAPEKTVTSNRMWSFLSVTAPPLPSGPPVTFQTISYGPRPVRC